MKANRWKNLVKTISMILLSNMLILTILTVTSLKVHAAITEEGNSTTYSYTGGVQTFTVPYTGLYKLEVWGAQGGDYELFDGFHSSHGAGGGYSVGYKELKKGQVLYICVGGKGLSFYGKETTYRRKTEYTGYNGGGGCVYSSTSAQGTGGGGATHIALVNGTLASIGYNTFVNQGKGLIVAGGAGGASNNWTATVYNTNGGGGEKGDDGPRIPDINEGQSGKGGTQTKGGASVKAERYDDWGHKVDEFVAEEGSFGQGSAGKSSGHYGSSATGGGGGFFGGSGGAAIEYRSGATGGGGSGWIGGVPSINFKGNTYSPSMQNGVNTNGNGKANITLVKKSLDIESITPSTTKWAKSIELTVNAIGASSYSIGGSYQTSPTFTVDENKTYTLYAKDKEGSIVSKTIKITNIDKTAPTLSLSQSTTSWTNANVTLTATAKDTQSGINTYAWYKNGQLISKETSNLCLASENATYKCIVKDKAGNETEKQITISNIDKTLPSVSLSASNTELTNQPVTITAAANDDESGINLFSWYKNGALIENENTYSIKVTENGTYKCVVTDKANNSVSETLVVTWIDTTKPTIDSDTETLASSDKSTHSLRVSDNEELESIEILLNGTIVDSISISGKSYTHTFNATENGSYEVIVRDKAGNVNEEYSFNVVCIVKKYTIDEIANLYHVHYGIDNTTTSNGCFNESYIEDGFTKYTCSRLNQQLGSLTLHKATNGEYVLYIENQLSINAQIVSYEWHGEDTTTENSLYPSVHPNGKKPSDVNGKAEKEIAIPDFGYYTCNVTYKDLFSEQLYNVVFYYTVEDFDLEPPMVTNIKRSYPKYANLKGADFSKIIDDSRTDGNNVVGFKDNDVTTIITENTVTPYEAEEEILFELSDNMSLNSIMCLETGKSYTFADSDKLLKSDGITAQISSIDLGLTQFSANGIYHFKLTDMILNEYEFFVEITRVDNGDVDIRAVASTPSSEVRSKSYVLKVSSVSYSPMYYQFLRKWEDSEHNSHYEVYKDWSNESFCEITDNGCFAVKVANSALTKNTVNDETNPLKLYDKEFVKIWTFNGDFSNYKLSYSLCDTTAPIIKDLKISATADMVIVTVIAQDDYANEDDLIYSCDKAYKQKNNIFYITTNGTYTFSVADECGNTSEKSLYIDLEKYGVDKYGIVSDITYDYIGETYTASGKTYTNTGVNATIKYKDGIDESRIFTKVENKGEYKNLFTYQFLENGTYTLLSRNTALESENVPEVLYKDKIVVETIDKVAPSVSIEIKDNKAYITATDEVSGVGSISILTTTVANSQTDKVDYSDSKKSSVTYILPLEYNVIQTISVFDNVGNQSTEYSISTDGVLEGGFKNLFVVVFVDSNRNVLSEQILLKGANAIAPSTPIRTGYTFERWSVDFTNVHSNLTVYPVYMNNVTNELDLDKVELDESWHIALLGHTFAYSTGGDSDIDRYENLELTEKIYTIVPQEESTEIINLSDYAVPLAMIRAKVYSYCGLSLIVMLTLIYLFNKIQERILLKKERL